jgi:hypothetical protein
MVAGVTILAPIPKHDLNWGVYFTSEGEFTGLWSNARGQHGYGTMIYNANSTRRLKDKWSAYSGEWQDGHFHGHGTLYFTGGARYDGGWKHGKRHGNAVMTYIPHQHSPRVRFVGDYIEDVKHSGILEAINSDRKIVASYSGKHGHNGFNDTKAWVTVNGKGGHRNYKNGAWVDKPPGVADALPELLKCEL